MSWNCCGPGGTGAEHRHNLLRISCESAKAAQELTAAFWASVSSRPKRLAVYVNPAGGTGRALALYEQEVQPLVRLAGASAVVSVTRHQGHAVELASSLDPQQFDAVVVVSGDGLLHEVYNGLCQNPHQPAAAWLPLAIIPAGSGNAFARSLAALSLERNSCTNAALAVLTCQAASTLDVAVVHQLGLQRPMRSLLSLSWGLVADIDIESEYLRFLGGSRFTVQAIVRVASLRRYSGVLIFQPPPGTKSVGDRHATAQEMSLAAEIGVADSGDNSWYALDGPFDSFWALNVAWGGETVLAAPHAVPNDGCFDLVVVRNGSALDIAGVLIAFDDGGHIEHGCVTVVKATAFVLTPGSPLDCSSAGVVVLDGEKVATCTETGALPLRYAAVGVRVQQGAARILTRKPRK